MTKRFRVIWYSRFEPEPEDVELLTREEAESEKRHLEFLFPEDIFKIEEVDE